MNKAKKSISIIIEILLIFSIMLMVLSMFIKWIVLNENTYINILNKNNVYEQVKESVYNKIDAELSAKNINYDIKESIITEDDIKREADNMISGFINYLKTGENNIKPIDSAIYKQRVSDILHSVIYGIVKSNTNDLSFNDNLQMKNVVYVRQQTQFDNKLLVKDNSKGGQDHIVLEKLMTKSEAEDKVREILKQKGLTEEQAIEKATKKGLTEEQALKILRDYGITIDDMPDQNGKESKSESSDNNKIQSDNNNVTENSNEETSSSVQIEGTVNHVETDKNIKNPLDKIADKLINEAGSSIEKEVEKINIDKILKSSKLEKLAKVISIIYKVFWAFMLLPFILIVILVKINSKDLNSSLKYIRNALLLAGLTIFLVCFGAYILKIYERININIPYFNDVIFYIFKSFLMTLSAYGFITCLMGVFVFILEIKKARKTH